MQPKGKGFGEREAKARERPGGDASKSSWSPAQLAQGNRKGSRGATGKSSKGWRLYSENV